MLANMRQHFFANNHEILLKIITVSLQYFALFDWLNEITSVLIFCDINRLQSCFHSTGAPDLGCEEQQRVKTTGLGFYARAIVLSWVCAGEVWP